MAIADKDTIDNTPILPYEGGKATLRKWIIDYIPSSGSVYVEPFAGRGNVFWLVASCCRYESWWLNDIRTYRLFEAIQRVDLSELPGNITKIDEQRYLDGVKEGSQDWLAICLEPWITHVGDPLIERTGVNAKYRSSFGPGKVTPGLLDGRAKKDGWSNYRMEKCYKQLNIAKSILAATHPTVTRELVFSSVDCGLPWNEWMDDERAFIYLDPPYLKASVISYKGSEFDPERMIDTLLECKCRWLLSEYMHPLYLKWLGNPISTLKVRASMKMRKSIQDAGDKPERIECLWSNYVL